jgi:hypothetical protein
MMNIVHELRPQPRDGEKITIKLDYVDLGHTDLMVQDGFYPNRMDFIRNTQPINRHADLPPSWGRGRPSISASDTRAAGTWKRRDAPHRRARAGEHRPGVTPDLARAAIASVAVLGALHACPKAKIAPADRTH